MTASDVRPRASVPLTIAGLALLIVPLIAAGLKFASFGWLMVFALWSIWPPALLILGWIVQIVVASTGYFGRRGLFARHATRRAVVIAWVTSIGALLVAFFFVDGADTTWGSTFMYWTGTGGDDTLGAVSSTIATIALVPWIGGWLWLVVEWIIAIVVRGREHRAARAD